MTKPKLKSVTTPIVLPVLPALPGSSPAALDDNSPCLNPALVPVTPAPTAPVLVATLPDTTTLPVTEGVPSETSKMYDPPGLDMNNFTVDILVETYVALRERKALLTRELEANIVPLEEGMHKISLALDRRLTSNGADSIRTKHGIVYRTTKRFSTCGDWGAFGQWVIENARPDLFQRRLNNAGVIELLEGGVVLPGVQVVSQQEIAVRKS